MQDTNLRMDNYQDTPYVNDGAQQKQGQPLAFGSK